MCHNTACLFSVQHRYISSAHFRSKYKCFTYSWSLTSGN